MPIKIVDKNINSLKDEVVIGKGAVTAVAGIPVLSSKKKQSSQRVWRVLLDSGSDGDILFLHGSKTCDIPYDDRFKPQLWRTLNGTFTTTKLVRLELSFPEFSRSKTALLKPDIFNIPKEQPKPVYDLIIGVKSMINLGCILDFQDQRVTLDRVTLPMHPHDSLMDPKALNSQFCELLEPAAMREATHRAVEILDAKYEKADLPAVIEEHCSHLKTYQKKSLLKLLQQHEELFDGTLGNWKTPPVSLELKEGAKP